MKTKEEIQVEVNVYTELKIELDKFFHIEHNLNEELVKLGVELKSAKSIVDLQREAFEAGRFKELNHNELEYEYKYRTFEDYLKSKK